MRCVRPLPREVETKPVAGEVVTGEEARRSAAKAAGDTMFQERLVRDEKTHAFPAGSHGPVTVFEDEEVPLIEDTDFSPGVRSGNDAAASEDLTGSGTCLGHRQLSRLKMAGPSAL